MTMRALAKGRLAMIVAALLVPSLASANPDDIMTDCKAELERRGVSFKPAKKPGIAIGVEITGPLGGIPYTSAEYALVIDCSLAVSLDEAGRYLRELGVTKASFSSAYSKRNVRGT